MSVGLIALLDDVAALGKGRRGIAGRHRRSSRQGRCQGGRRGHRRCRRHAPLRHRLRGGARIADHPQDRLRVAQEQAVDPAAGSARAQPAGAAGHHPAADDRRRLSLLRRCRKDLRTRRAACRARARGRTGLDRSQGAILGGSEGGQRDQDGLHPLGRDHGHHAGLGSRQRLRDASLHSGGGGRGHHRLRSMAWSLSSSRPTISAWRWPA